MSIREINSQIHSAVQHSRKRLRHMRPVFGGFLPLRAGHCPGARPLALAAGRAHGKARLHTTSVVLWCFGVVVKNGPRPRPVRRAGWGPWLFAYPGMAAAAAGTGMSAQCGVFNQSARPLN